MKVLIFILFSLLLFLSCQHTNRSQVASQDDVEEAVDSIPKATAIFWVDKSKSNLTQKKDYPFSVRTVKVKADIDSIGKVTVLSYVKPQDKKVIKYLQYRLDIFRVKKIMLDSGFVKTGVQYVQLRYVPDKMQKYR